MKKIAIILVLAIFILASGCSYYNAKKTEKEANEYLDDIKAQSEEMNSQMADQMRQVEPVRTTSPPVTKDYDEEADKKDEVLYIGDENTGLKSLGSSYRDKEATEHCDFDYPFTCMSYIASEGRVDITLKYLAYQGALKEVTLYMNNEMCDPSNSYVEPGDKQKFTCYADDDSNYISGKLELEYYETLKRVDLSTTGSVYTMWE